jgi:tetratricopeptide (TPR) repeat protein
LLDVPLPPNLGKRLSMARAKAMAASGDILACTGEVSRARTLAQSALILSENVDGDIACMSRLVLARCCLEERDTHDDLVEEARTLATKGLNHAIANQLYPQVYQGLNLMAELSVLGKKLDKAGEYFEKMIKLADDKKLGLAWRGIAMQKLAELKESIGELAAAERLHQEAVTLLTGQLSKTYKSLVALVRIYENLGNHEAAASFGRMIMHVKEDHKKD